MKFESSQRSQIQRLAIQKNREAFFFMERGTPPPVSANDRPVINNATVSGLPHLAG